VVRANVMGNPSSRINRVGRHIWAFIVSATIIVAIGSPADAAEVFSEGGRIMLVNNQKRVQLTAGPADHDPVLSPDGSIVVFSREIERRITSGACCEGAPPRANQLWMIGRDGIGARLLVRENEGTPGDEWAETVITRFNEKQFSSDGRYLYFLTPSWVTSSALHVYDFVANRTRYIGPANDLIVLSDCLSSQYHDLLAVKQHRYFVGGGSYNWYWLIDSDRKEIGPIGPDVMKLTEACRIE